MASFSNDVKVTNFIFKNNEPMYSNTSWTGQRIVRSTGIQYYQIQFTLNFIKTSIPEIQQFIAQYSQGGSFTMSLGVYGDYYGSQSGALTATAAAPAGNIVISTNANNMAVGELIQFSNHNKIYRIIARTANTVTVFPALQNQVQAQEVIKYDNLVIEAQLDPDNDYSITVGNLMNITLKAQEVIY
ncbi:hypothetical protein ACP3S7_02840 [Phytobacter ursingii]